MSKTHEVLYVDDEKSNLFFFEQLLKDKLNVFTAPSGKEGLDLLRKHPGIRIIFSDMKMPSLNGMEFIEMARTMFSDKQYVIVTSYAIDDLVAEALDHGIVRKCIQKPIDPEEIVQLVDEMAVA